MSGTGTGRGFKGFLAFSEESASAPYGTPVAASIFPQTTKESLESDEGWEYPEAIMASSGIYVGAAGRRTIKGSIDVIADAYSLGWLLKWATRAVTDSNAGEWPPKLTALDGAAAAGGSLPPGVYGYKASPIYQIAGTNNFWFAPLSDAKSITTAQQTVSLCNTNWTNSGTAVCASDATDKKEGTASQKVTAPAEPETATLYAFSAVTGDFHTYQKIHLWIKNEAVVATNDWNLCLCSDASGAVVVDTLPIPAIATTGSWVELILDKGSALSAGIQSVALYSGTHAPVGSKYVKLDDIRAVNLTARLSTWTPPTPPADYPVTLYGTAIFRTAAGGTDYFYLGAVIGAGTTYSDDGSVALSTKPAPTQAPYKHTFNGGSGTQKAFTTEVFLDVGKSKQVSGCKVASVDLKMGNSGPMTFTAAVIGKDLTFIDQSTPAFSPLMPFRGNQALVFVQPGGSADTLLASNLEFSLKFDNHLEEGKWQNGDRSIGALDEGYRSAEASFQLAMRSTLQAMYVLTNPTTFVHMSYHILTWAGPLDEGACVFSPAAGVTVIYWPYTFEAILPKADYDALKAPLENKGQVKQSINLKRALIETGTYNDDIILRMTDLTPTRADVA